MKIRIKGNTLRYRLSKSDVTALTKNGVLEEKTEFISNSLIYSIGRAADDQFSADFIQHKITLYIPDAALQQWANTDQVSLEHHLPIANGQTMYLLLEKDFKCIDGDATDDQSDYFENPHLTC